MKEESPNCKTSKLLTFKITLMKSAQLRSAFTLIELLIVIAILGILAAAVLVAINPGKRTAQARDAQRKSAIGSIANALIGYYTLSGKFPDEVTCDSSKGTMGGAGDCRNVVGGGSWRTFSGGAANSYVYNSIVDTQGFLKSLPHDPLNDLTHYYRYEPFENLTADFLCFAGGPACEYYWVGTLLEAPADISKPIFRCTDIANIGTGCKEVRCGNGDLWRSDAYILDPTNEC